MFSVVVPLYNKEKSILKTMESILSQTFTDFEVIVVNDGSTDGSLKVLETVHDARVRVFTKENGGVSSARNYGILKASYDLVAFIDGDDAWDESYLEQMAGLIARYPECSVFGSAWCRTTNGVKEYEDFGLEKDLAYKIDRYFKQAVKHTLLCTSSAIVRKSALVECGMFDTNLVMGEDMDLWIRLNLNYEFAFLNMVLAFYIQDAENRACNTGLKPLKRNILSRLADYAAAETKNRELKLYLDSFRVRQCIPYFFTKENKQEVLRIVSQVDYSALPFYWRIIYSRFAWEMKRRMYQLYKKTR